MTSSGLMMFLAHKVIDFGTNQKQLRDCLKFLLVYDSNLGPICTV